MGLVGPIRLYSGLFRDSWVYSGLFRPIRVYSGVFRLIRRGGRSEEAILGYNKVGILLQEREVRG